MSTPVQKRKKELLHKQEILNKAKKVLKQEFVGINKIIDEIVDAISSWYLFPDFQENPVIINLWGLTGVGKTSLIKRLAQLINFENKFYHFDLGEKGSKDFNIKNQLINIYKNVNSYPVLIALDEFQHARTINELGKEISNSSSQIIWQLLDSGKFHISDYSFELDEIYTLIQNLRYLLKGGVKVSKGKVISKKEYFIKEMALKEPIIKIFESQKNKPDTNNLLFVPNSYHECILSLAKDKFSTIYEVKEKLLKLNGYETIKFLLEIFTMGNSPKQVDCSKGLIFVLGNLDEAYTMSQDFNPDMDADEFHDQSLKINIPIIKRALKKRFRNEQIARLGNIHFIYPAFKKKTFKKIIEQELSKIIDKVKRHQKINIQFDTSIHDLIYKEGVYPTQGARPIFSTIHQIIYTKLGRIISEIIIKNLDASCIVFKAKENIISAEYYNGNLKIHSLSFKQPLSLEMLRENKRDDLQALTAVHEAGHAVISSILLHTVPEVIYSNSVEETTGGFVYTKFKWKYISRKEITNRLALYLGGFAAEKVVFGEENITIGAEDDIEKATKFITKMLKQCGMGKIPAAYNVKGYQTRNYLYDREDKLNQEAEKWISESLLLAEKTLKEQILLLLKIADYLSDNRYINKIQITEMLTRYGKNLNPNMLTENGDLLFYRNHLKRKIATLNQTENKNY